MKTLNLSRNILLVLVLPFFFFACNDEQEERTFELQVDAYIVKKKIDGEIRFANAYFAYGTYGIKSATVTPPALAGSSVELDAAMSTSSIFFKEPATEDFSNMTPAQGEYIFDVESRDGVVLQQSDIIEGEMLSVPVITEATFQSDIVGLTVSWDSAFQADGFVLKLLNQNKRVVFTSYTLLPSATEYEINQASGNWDENVYVGEDYTLQVQAFTYESSASQDNLLYNINEAAISEMEITWGNDY